MPTQTFGASALSRHLLGDVDAGPGLIRRVATKVVDLAEDSGPAYVTGSIMGTGSNKAGGYPLEDAGRIFDLAILVSAFLDDERGPVELKAFIHRNRMTDVDYLLGTPKQRYRGAIAQVLDRARSLLKPEFPGEKAMAECGSLLDALMDWLGDECLHDFQPAPTDVEATSVMICRCGAAYVLYGDNPEWFALNGG